LLIDFSNLFDAIGTFSCEKALWNDMRFWEAVWLDRWVEGAGILEAMSLAQRDVSGEARVIPILVGGIPEDMAKALVADLSGRYAMDVYELDGSPIDVAIQFWSTGNLSEIWTGPVRTVHNKIAMSCRKRKCGGGLWGVHTKRNNFDQKLKPMKCPKCGWTSARIRRPSFIQRGTYPETNEPEGIKHRYLWRGIFPMPRLLTKKLV
jgi:hypothetical protein